MVFNETGFRAFYHQICALELNDFLRDLIKDCPESDKSSHVVVYGYIDPQKGLMLEILGGGKQAPKYFYFKEPYEGEHIRISISKVADVPFLWFEKLEPRFQKKYAPRIETLKQYDAPKDVEESRSFGFLDDSREPAFPDDIKVKFLKEGFKTEECWVRITGLGDHCLVGTLLNQPYQDYGVNKGDSIKFFAHETDEKKVICVARFDEEKLSASDLEDGTILKGAITDYQKNESEEALQFIFSVLRSSELFVPSEMRMTKEAKAIVDKLEASGSDSDSLSEEERKTLNEGVDFIPKILSNEGHRFYPVFTDPQEYEGKIEDCTHVRMPFTRSMEMALQEGEDVEGIVINAFTQSFVILRDQFKTISEMNPLVEEEAESPDERVHLQSAGTKQSVFAKSDRLQIRVGKMDVFNYALYQNGISPIRGVSLFNQTGDAIEGLHLHISSDMDLFKEYDAVLPPIPSGKPVDLDDPRLHINGNALTDLTEMINATVTVELVQEGEAVCGCRGVMKVLAYDQWQGSETYRDLLPAFVLPNHPVIPGLMHEASERLKKWGKSPSLEGYQQNDPNRVRDLAAAAYAAIQKKNIVYAEPPASFDVIGQRVRTPESIIEQRLGTCMDMTLLYTACLEAMGLHPLLVLMDGHIYAGLWLKERSREELLGSNVVMENPNALRSKIDNGLDEMTFVECTAMCSGKQIDFEEAEKAAKYGNLADTEAFRFAIDVACARIHDIKPIPSRIKDSGSYQIQIEEISESDVTAAPTNLGISIAPTVSATPKKITNKKELWESKLLDLSQHNMLLNLPLNSSVMPIMSSHIDELEDALADGSEFHMLPVADWIADLSFTKRDEGGKESKPKNWLAETLKEWGVFEMTHWPVSEDFDFNEKFRQEYRSHRLYTYCSPKQLEKELTTIYRAARSSQQENGVSSLYLSIGLMRWFPEPDSKTPCYAPLILLPIEIIRKSANQGYALRSRDEDAHFNSTLLEMLKQNYNLEIPGLEPLPSDGHGVDIKRVFALVRGALYTLRDWDVVETCVIGNFSFAQFAMWNDIHTAGELLDDSNIVRSLMKGHVDWDISLPENLDEDNVYLPITVDATQLKAIKLAAHGTTFVLHGPPGTGKSQTITGMIANLLAQGKRVLFVAEKMAALSVVEKRLTSLGIGDFCLELHSNKANKKQVLQQLDKALAIKHPSKQTEYQDYLQRATASREKLDDYAKHLHAAHNSGYSLRELIDLYEGVRDEENMICFDSFAAGQMSRADIQRHLPLLGQLTAAGASVGVIKDNPLSGVGLNSFSAEVRSELHGKVSDYSSALADLQSTGIKAASCLGQDVPTKRSDFDDIYTAIKLFFEKKDDEPALMDSIESSKDELSAFFAKEKILLQEKQALLATWKEGFLEENIAAYKERHVAAEKKFIGKASAMQAVVNELQTHALQPLSFEQIPALLQDVENYQNNIKTQISARAALSEASRAVLDQFPSEEAFYGVYERADGFRKQVEAFPGGLEALRSLEADSDALQAFSNYQECYQKLQNEEQAFNTLLMRENNDSAEDWIKEEANFCQYLNEHPASLKDWGLYNQIRHECLKVGLKPVVDAYETQSITGDLVKSYKKGLYYALINDIISTDDVLSSFSGVTFNESIQQFKRLDDAMLQQTKSEIFYLLASRVPDSWSSPEMGAELNLLRKAIGSNARGMSIRALFDRIPNVLKTLSPCMLMSPNSVAQYLAQDGDLFDVVIFDEASQLPTCKAVGALIRAKNAVIVGDPKQMPPTSFFAGSGPNIEDLALADLDSILDDALALGIPSQFLQWHYRSTHESLIAFSNNQFYENKMFTFPSANDRERHVTAVHVDGVYKSSTNVKEAEAVVAEIVRRFMDPELKKQSIGVVTFNVKQQNLIEDLLSKQYQNNAEMDAWANTGEDPLFVKNLENVQGDERDVIIFSIGYGPDEKGRISMNFGPINQTGGGKRLNVAFSRARVTMMIFSSIYSSDLKLTETSPDGLVAFRNFLRFAEGHDLDGQSQHKADGDLTKEGILNSICMAITENGFQCTTMVGHSDFHVDIAVIDPNEPTKYMMGILLDGDGYKQTKNTRDREIAQISVLRNLGWKLHRVWTIDWWDNRKNELRKLIDSLEKLKAESDKRLEERKVKEAAQQVDQATREAEASKLRNELEKQAAEVIADEQESAEAEKAVRVVVETPISSPAANNRNTVSTDSSLPQLLQRLHAAGAEIVDKRQNGGALWVVGGKELQSLMGEFRAVGIHFIFKAGGGKATEGKDGWWARTDITIPTDANSGSVPSSQTNMSSEEAAPQKTEEETVSNRKTDEAPIDKIEESSTTITDSRSSADGMITEPVPYQVAELQQLEMNLDDYIKPGNKNEIGRRALAIVEAEGPILRDTLIRRILSSYGVNKSGAAVDATDKALRSVKIKQTKQKGIVFCWAAGQDPNDYRGIRISNERAGNEICPQELRNAACYALNKKGELGKDDLLKEISLVLGYKRLGKNLEADILAGVQFARATKAIIYVPGGTYRLP